MVPVDKHIARFGLRVLRGLACVAVVFGLATQSVAVPGDDTDAKTRLGLFVNFAKFAEWPDSKGPSARGEWVFCFPASDDPILSLAKRLDGQLLYDQPITVRVLAPETSIVGCHVLYVPDALAEESVMRVKSLSEAHHVLTVSARNGFTQRGGMIGVVVDGDRYRFDVDYGAVVAAGLKLDPRLLNLARRID